MISAWDDHVGPSGQASNWEIPLELEVFVAGKSIDL